MTCNKHYEDLLKAILLNLESGFFAQIKAEIEGYSVIWVQIKKVENDIITGVFLEKHQMIKNKEIKFTREDILMLRGDLNGM